MKKLISVLLILAMLAAMIPAAFVATSAEPATATPTGNWTDEGNYDISWCKTLDSKTSETLEVNSKYYLVYPDWKKNTYSIQTAAQLAGLAYLSNKASGDIFKGDKFMIEADLDLSTHYWIPISQNSKFRGSLIGKLNGVDGAVATITGMTIQSTSGAVGLVGKFGGDWIENLKLVNAKISATKFTVGSFVGWQHGNVGSGVMYGKREGGYRNLYADTDIVLTSGSGDKYDDVGGIVGIINGCTTDNLPTVIDKCVFTGTISAQNADTVGGIVAYVDGANMEQAASIITDCVVISEKMEFGAVYTAQDWETGFGGIAGTLYSGLSGDNASKAPSNVSNCYVAAKMIVSDASDSKSTSVGGIVGTSCSQTKTYTDCQFDGIIVGAATYRRTAGILGRSVDNTTFNNCVVSGIALGVSDSGVLNASRLCGTDYSLTVSNVYTSVKMSDKKNSGSEATQITADTDVSALLAQKDADGNAIWVKAEGSLYPILAIAKNYLNDGNKHLSVALSGADLSWFNPSDTGRTKTVTNERELWALEKLLTAAGAKQSAFLTLQKINVRNVLIPMLDDLSSDMKAALLAKTVAKTDATKVVNVYAQTSKAVTEGSNCYAVRFVAEINGNQWAGAGFDLLVSYTTADGVKMTSKLTEQTVSVCYKSISAGDDSVTAPDGHYFIVFVLDQVPVSNGNMTFTVAAYANGADGAVYGNAGVVTFDTNGSVVAD